VAGDIVSCSSTSDKCDKFGDYFCLTNYVETTTTIFPPSLWAQVLSDARRTNNGPDSFKTSAFQCAIYFIASYTLFFLRMRL